MNYSYAASKLDAMEVRDMCTNCYNLTIGALKNSNYFYFRDKFIKEGIVDLLKIHHQECQYRIVQPEEDVHFDESVVE